MTAYYNEIDPKAATWLRELIKNGHIAPGDVDEQDIRDIKPHELRPYSQCHFFAGIGTWSYALRNAGWSDERSVWTGSCPCQPFSTAGAGEGFADERHLWPAWFHLIEECRPTTVFGEQVASKAGLNWLDLVQADMEGAEYAFGPFDLCAASVGAPHIRQRLWFVGEGLADSHSSRKERIPGDAQETPRLQAEEREPEDNTNVPERSGSDHDGPGGLRGDGLRGSGGLGVSDSYRCEERGEASKTVGYRSANQSTGGLDRCEPPGPTNGFWRDADWLRCTDGKWRSVEPGTSPLAHGSPQRVVRLRGYGNGIVAPLATMFIKSYLEAV